ncbi:ABC transporter permease [Clostridium sp. AM58-1XD]|uniref:ABC transporter permease n=1 Tax=Clostridium sp. AM58-1XD TaxID=2292307 RepID=UPI000E4CD76B|nr:ABC transporter permease [Clostridium sp. AM58-1XD]RGY96177.1 ABC transporter permease [Clostridium sp. AM58-1XD]
MQFNMDLILSILASTLRSSVPLILAAMGGCFSMRAGVSDLGLEGMMLAGSFFAVLGSWITGNAWLGLLTGILFGAVFSMLHAVMHISYKVNASISGMCVNLLAGAVTPLLLNVIFGMSGKSVSVAAFAKPDWGLLEKIPIIGRILGAQNILFFITIFLVIVSWIFLYKTKYGLRMRMVSENPQAASTVGLNVRAYKYFGVAMSGAFAGLGGAYLSLGQMNLFVEDMTSGRGYIAVVINAFGRYNPAGALAGSLFFGFFDSLQTVFQSILPSQLVMMTPYVFTLLVITFGLKGGKAPAGVGKHVES